MGVGGERSENALHASGSDFVRESPQVMSGAGGDAHTVRLAHPRPRDEASDCAPLGTAARVPE